MKLTKIMLGGVAIAGLMGAAPALAFTHHPGTPAEHQQTDDLNAQQLQQAQSGTPPATTAAAASTAAPMTAANNTMPLDSVKNSPETLANASVETSNGQAIGAVQRVITDAAGNAKTVVVSLLGKASRLVAIAANQLTFDQSRNVVVAQMSADQIDNLPMAPRT
jgi:hypothetical protein